MTKLGRILCAGLASLLTAIACRDSNGVPPVYGLTLVTDSSLYHARSTGPVGTGTGYMLSVAIGITNTGNVPVDLPKCGSIMYRVRQVDPAGESAFNPSGWDLICPREHVRIGAGDTYLWKLELRAPNLVDGVTHEPKGVFGGRVRVALFSPEAESNEFVIAVDAP